MVDGDYIPHPHRFPVYISLEIAWCWINTENAHCSPYHAFTRLLHQEGIITTGGHPETEYHFLWTANIEKVCCSQRFGNGEEWKQNIPSFPESSLSKSFIRLRLYILVNISLITIRWARLCLLVTLMIYWPRHCIATEGEWISVTWSRNQRKYTFFSFVPIPVDVEAQLSKL